MRWREKLNAGAAKVELFLSDLAVTGHVAPPTQNQALHGLLFMYRHVLDRGVEFVEGFARAWRILLKNLTPGTTYTVKARAVGGSTGYSEWSDPVSHMAM